MSRPFADDWKACPPGELGRLSSRLRERRTRRTLARSGIAVALIAFLALGIWTFRPRGDTRMDLNYAGIRCSRVTALAHDYALHKLDPRLNDQIRAHVEQCPRCHERFKAMGLISWLWRYEPLRQNTQYLRSIGVVQSSSPKDSFLHMVEKSWGFFPGRIRPDRSSHTQAKGYPSIFIRFAGVRLGPPLVDLL